MTIRIEVLHLAVVGPFVADVECARDGAAIWVEPVMLENLFVQVVI
jgi:hypothetical protein